MYQTIVFDLSYLIFIIRSKNTTRDYAIQCVNSKNTIPSLFILKVVIIVNN